MAGKPGPFKAGSTSCASQPIDLLIELRINTPECFDPDSRKAILREALVINEGVHGDAHP